MNWDEIKGNWKQLKAKAQAKWGDITDDEWHKIEGRREELIGVVQAKMRPCQGSGGKRSRQLAHRGSDA